jgi:hypothetical protein
MEGNMKKISLLTLLLIFAISSFAFAGPKIILKVGLDTLGTHEISILGLDGSEDVKTGLSISGEFINEVNDKFDIGAGITLQTKREQRDYAGEFSFVPIYALARYHPDPVRKDFYFIGQLGFNLFQGDSDYKGAGSLSGGKYFGFGMGAATQEKWQIEMLYNRNDGEYEVYGITGEVTYSILSFSVGHIF